MKAITLLLCAALFASCDKALLDTPVSNSPRANFESLWTEFDEKYGQFEVKNIDWDSVYTAFEPRIDAYSTEAELHAVFKEMLALLNDNHVALVPSSQSGLPMFQSGILGHLDTIHDFDLDLLKRHYLPDAAFEDPFFTYGILEGNIGYVHIEGFSDRPKALKKPMDRVLDKLKNTKGLIIDVRGGYGGEDLAGQYIAGRFASASTPYMKTRVKSGAGKDDFTPYEVWEVQPEGDQPYRNPMSVLTHRFTISARETFCLAMKVLPQVTFVGDTTSGAFSNQINRELPNGWGYSLSIGQWTDASGKSYEGTGLAPDLLVQNKKAEVQNGKDEALEAALALLR